MIVYQTDAGTVAIDPDSIAAIEPASPREARVFLKGGGSFIVARTSAAFVDFIEQAAGRNPVAPIALPTQPRPSAPIVLQPAPEAPEAATIAADAPTGGTLTPELAAQINAATAAAVAKALADQGKRTDTDQAPR